MIDLDITEPMNYFSNIQGGMRVIGFYSLDETEVDVIKVIGRHLNSFSFQQIFSKLRIINF